MGKLEPILCLLVLTLAQPASPGDGGGAKTPPGGRIAVLRKQIETLRTKKDVQGLQKLGAEIKAEWLAKKSPTHYQAILDLCLAICSTRTTEPGINESIRDLVADGLPAAWREGPLLETVEYPDVLVSKAVSDGAALDPTPGS